jgi:hypothetical protein
MEKLPDRYNTVSNACYSAYMLYVEPWAKPQFQECFWYHTVDVPGVGLVEGQWDLRGKFEDYTGNEKLSGKRLLDIGTASGFLTWEAEAVGAEVVSFDLDHARRQRLLPFRNSVYMQDRHESEEQRDRFFSSMKKSYWYMWHTLRSRAKVFYGDIENLPASLGRFDVVLFGSVLEHLPDHIQAIGTAAMLADTIIITGPIGDTEVLMADFTGRSQNPAVNYNFWRYSAGVYREIFAMLGFQVERITGAKYRFIFGGRQDVELQTLVARRAN